MPPTVMETFTGKQVDCLDPDPSQICIEDLAHHLANVNRFGGAAPEPYSVAEHSVRMSFACPPGLALECLLHDAAEAYLGDMPRPYKSEMPQFKEFEASFESAIRRALDMPGDSHPPEVKHWDNVMLITEARSFGLSWWDTGKWGDITPLPIDITPWHWMTAKDMFLTRYEELS